MTEEKEATFHILLSHRNIIGRLIERGRKPGKFVDDSEARLRA